MPDVEDQRYHPDHKHWESGPRYCVNPCRDIQKLSFAGKHGIDVDNFEANQTSLDLTRVENFAAATDMQELG